MTERVARPIREAAIAFLRGDTSVVDFTYAFRNAVQEVAIDQPLQGLEVEQFEALEVWESAGWRARPDVVDRLRELARAAAAE